MTVQSKPGIVMFEDRRTDGGARGLNDRLATMLRHAGFRIDDFDGLRGGRWLAAAELGDMMHGKGILEAANHEIEPATPIGAIMDAQVPGDDQYGETVFETMCNLGLPKPYQVMVLTRFDAKHRATWIARFADSNTSVEVKNRDCYSNDEVVKWWIDYAKTLGFTSLCEPDDDMEAE